MKPHTPRQCKEFGCLDNAEPGYSRCVHHGAIAADAARADRLREAEWQRDRRNEQVRQLAEMFSVDADAIDALVEFVRGGA